MNHRIAYRTRIAVVGLLGLPLGVRGGDIKIVEGIPPGFEMVRLTHDPTMLHSVPDINDTSEVVFGKFITAQALGNLYRFSDGVIRKLTDEQTYDLNPVTNNVSQMAWMTCEDSDGPFDVVTDYTAGEVLSGEAHPIGFVDMNDAGDVVWQHRPKPGVSEFDIYLYTHATGRVEPLTDGGNNQAPRINNAGQVVWTLYDFSVNPWVGHIMLYSDGKVSEITQEECQCQGSDINDVGHVVWSAGNDLVFWDGSTGQFIANPASTARINQNDEIAFSLWDFNLELWKHAIFVDGTIFVLPHFGLTTARRSLNDCSEMAMKSHHPATGNSDLFLLRRIAPKGDFNHDCHVDSYDFWIFQRCVTAQPGPDGALLAECIRGDFDDDGDIDPVDLAAFDAAYTGPGTMVENCEP